MKAAQFEKIGFHVICAFHKQSHLDYIKGKTIRFGPLGPAAWTWLWSRWSYCIIVPEFCNDWMFVCLTVFSVFVHVHVIVHMPQHCFYLRCPLWSCLTVPQWLRGCACVYVHVSASCLLYFHVSHLVISAPVSAIAAMQWHMPTPWLPDWQHGCCGEIKRMLEQITPCPLPSSDWQAACRSALPTLFYHLLQVLQQISHTR